MQGVEREKPDSERRALTGGGRRVAGAGHGVGAYSAVARSRRGVRAVILVSSFLELESQFQVGVISGPPRAGILAFGPRGGRGMSVSTHRTNIDVLCGNFE